MAFSIYGVSLIDSLDATVSSRDDPVLADEGATAEVEAGGVLRESRAFREAFEALKCCPMRYSNVASQGWVRLECLGSKASRQQQELNIQVLWNSRSLEMLPAKTPARARSGEQPLPRSLSENIRWWRAVRLERHSLFPTREGRTASILPTIFKSEKCVFFTIIQCHFPSLFKLTEANEERPAVYFSAKPKGSKWRTIEPRWTLNTYRRQPRQRQGKTGSRGRPCCQCPQAVKLSIYTHGGWLN